MVRKYVLAGALAALAFGVGRPAAAGPVFQEEYGQIFGARPLLGVPDKTPGNAMMGVAAPGKDLTFFVSPFFRTYNLDRGDVTLFGGGVGVNGGATGTHPWEIYADFFNTSVDPDFGDSSDKFGWDVVGKFGLWDMSKNHAKGFAPVISLVGRYQDLNGLGNRWDVAFAVDQKILSNLYATINLGYGEADPDHGSNQSDFIPGFGLTWSPAHNLSLSADLTLDNNVDNDDLWSINAAYRFNNQFSFRVGGGKHDTIFANILYRLGGK